MNRVYDILEQIKNTPKSSEKIEILKHVSPEMNNILKVIFDDTYNKNIRYNIKKLPDIHQVGNMTIEDQYMNFHGALQSLAKREITGNMAKEFITNIISSFNKQDQDILLSILDRNLKIGISENTVQKLFGTNHKFEVALAKKYHEVKVDIFDGKWFVSRKLDGVRCIAIIDLDNNTTEFYSRTGKPYKTLNELSCPVFDLLKPLKTGKYVLDGEVCIVDENGEEHFDKIMDEVTRKNHTVKNPCYIIFDFLKYEEFSNQKESDIFETRIQKLYTLFEIYGKTHDLTHSKIQALLQKKLQSQEQFDKWLKTSRENNWEGLMVRQNIPYVSGRQKSLLKIKEFNDAEYVVEGVHVGQMTYNEDGHKLFDVVTDLVINHKGTIVKVGSGISKSQRIEWFKDPSKIIGKTITVQYFEETKNKKTNEWSLRFPVLKYVYDSPRDC